MNVENLYVTIPIDEYESLKKRLERAEQLVISVGHENSEVIRQNVSDTKTIVRLQNENETLKRINARLQEQITELRAGGK